MATKKKRNTPPQPPGHNCLIFGEGISGDPVDIKTKRRTELHIHNECMRGEKNVIPNYKNQTG